MSEATKPADGGTAFPFTERSGDGTHWHSHSGMSMRDWFAGQAIAGAALQDTGTIFREQVAEDAYKLADAMLAARGAS